MMANTILQSVQVEIEYHKYVSALDQVPKREKSIELSGVTQIQLGEAGEEKKAA